MNKIILFTLIISLLFPCFADSIKDAEKEWKMVKVCAITGCITGGISFLMYMLDSIQSSKDYRDAFKKQRIYNEKIYKLEMEIKKVSKDIDSLMVEIEKINE